MRNFAILVAAALSVSAVSSAAGSCRDERKCCPGRDSSCVVNGLDPYQAVRYREPTKPCYCDEGCLETGDCCADYKAFCSVEGELILRILSFQTELSNAQRPSVQFNQIYLDRSQRVRNRGNKDPLALI